MDTSIAPPITDELINYLKTQFPNELPPGRIDLRELDEKRGQQQVIDHLIVLKLQQEEDNLVLSL